MTAFDASASHPRTLAWVAVSDDVSLQIKQLHGKPIVWLDAPLRCDDEWKLATCISALLNSLAGSSDACRTAEVIDRAAGTSGSHVVLVHAPANFPLGEQQIQSVLVEYFQRVSSQREFAQQDVPKPVRDETKVVAQHANSFLERSGGKPLPRPVAVGVGEKVLANVRGRWAPGPREEDQPSEHISELLQFDGFEFSKRVIHLRSKKKGYEVCFDQEKFQHRFLELCRDMSTIYKVGLERRWAGAKETLHLLEIEAASEEDLATPLDQAA